MISDDLKSCDVLHGYSDMCIFLATGFIDRYRGNRRDGYVKVVAWPYPGRCVLKGRISRRAPRLVVSWKSGHDKARGDPGNTVRRPEAVSPGEGAA